MSATPQYFRLIRRTPSEIRAQADELEHSNVSPMAPKPVFVTVDPAMAEQWLKNKSRGRNVRARFVDQYASAMAEGRWTPDTTETRSADMISFATDGKLINGQHRLLAVIQSGVAIAFAVRKDVPVEANRAGSVIRRHPSSQDTP
jgi:hypothetical protein